MNLTAMLHSVEQTAKAALATAQSTLTTAQSTLASGAESGKALLTSSKVTAAAKVAAVDVTTIWAIAYAVDTARYWVNKTNAAAARDERLQAFLEATQGQDLSAQELELLSRTVPTLREPEPKEVRKAFVKRQINRAGRSAKITAWAYYGVYSAPAILPVSAVAWGQYFGVKAFNKVFVRKNASQERRNSAALRTLRAANRRRRMHSWIWRRTLGAGIRGVNRNYVPIVQEFYTTLPKIENGAIVYFKSDGSISRRISFVPPTPTRLEEDEVQPFTNTEKVNDNVFSEAKKITFDNEVKEAIAKPDTAREQAIRMLQDPTTVETVENWQLILEGADGYSKVGFDRCQRAFEQVLDTLPEGIEQDDPRRLGSAMAHQVKLTKRSQLNVARKALPFWVLANLNEVDVTQLDNEDSEAAFIDFTDKSGLLILQGWDDVVAKNLISAN